MPNFISEDDIERALLLRLERDFGYEVLNCYTSTAEDLNDRSGRNDKRDVILADRVLDALRRLNPGLPDTALDQALSAITSKRNAMSLIAGNRELYGLIRDGVQVEFDDAGGVRQQERARVMDFNDVDANRFLAVAQLWVKGDQGFRRPDILLYVNGIPLVFIELKNSNVALRNAYDDNVTNYKAQIPQLFLANAFCVLSNAMATRVGSMTAQWEHYFNWLHVNDEREKVDRKRVEQQGTSLEYLAAGLFPRAALLDYVENFVLYHNETQKIIAQNHQFLGVNKAYARFNERDKWRGKLGVFWHTQGAGKSFSMIFYARKIFRKATGNFTFVVVTDRDDLDGQIYRNFLSTGTVSEKEAARPKNSDELRRFLTQNKRLVFTLIQKFRYDKGKEYPLLSERDDIIVIVDEAHRTQYKSLAENMRAGLKNAQFLAFTGTPLLGTERKTNAWFGDYVSEYNFQQSMDDGATVPLYYQKRVPSVLIQNESLSEDFYEILESENLDEAQQEKLQSRFAKEIEVIKRDDRLETIAADIVAHFPNRGYLGKGLVVAVDKFTAVRMFDKVQRLWKERLKALQGEIKSSNDDITKARLKRLVDYMRDVEMAVVISEEAGEDESFAKQGLNVRPHRDRMNRLDPNGHDIEHNFKDPHHKLQLVFVCAMWLTGFDAPTLSTLYLDKPMKDHTLMQTIARANRVTSHQIAGKSKINGEIVDYYNVFRNMQKALQAYAQGSDGPTEPPVKELSALFALLDDSIEQGFAFCFERGVDLTALLRSADTFKKLAAFEEHANTLLGNDDWRKSFAVYENTISGLYEACKPEILGMPIVRTVAVFQYLRGVIDSIVQQADIDEVARRISELLDESLVVSDDDRVGNDPASGYIVQKGKTWDLSKIDFEQLNRDFEQTPHKNIEIADLRAFIEHKLEQMIEQNTTRVDFAQRLQAIIDAYNSGSASSDFHFDELVRFAQDLKAESERHLREGLTEEELELFDLLKKDSMTEAETQKVRLAAKSLLERLRSQTPRVLVQDWFKDSVSQQRVRSTVESVLDENLPDTYDRVLFKNKCDVVFDTMVRYAAQGRMWVMT